MYLITKVVPPSSSISSFHNCRAYIDRPPHQRQALWLRIPLQISLSQLSSIYPFHQLRRPGWPSEPSKRHRQRNREGTKKAAGTSSVTAAFAAWDLEFWQLAVSFSYFTRGGLIVANSTSLRIAIKLNIKFDSTILTYTPPNLNSIHCLAQ